MKKVNIKKLIKTAAVVLVGNALYAFAVTFFVVPSGLILGGFTGLSIAISHFISVEVSYLVLFFHLAAFVAGTIILGKYFAVSTAASTFLYPLFLNLFERLAGNFSLPFFNILPLNALISALIIGVSLGILTRFGTSTGGTEVIPLIINKLTGKSVGFILFILDGAIMLVQLTYSDITQIIYGVAIVALYSVIVHFISKRGKCNEV